jgi:hypothetical protein
MGRLTRYIVFDEFCYFYELVSFRGGPPAEPLSEAELADYERVMREFRAWQDRLEKMERDYKPPPKPTPPEEIAAIEAEVLELNPELRFRGWAKEYGPRTE